MNTTQNLRVRTGIAGLDTLLDGGLFAGGIYVVLGSPGTGKTTLANQMCFAVASEGQQAIYITLLTETHSRMMANMQAFDFFHPDAIGGAISYVGAYMVLREHGLTGFTHLVRRLLQEEHPAILIIDGSISPESLGTSAQAVREFIAELQAMCDVNACTAVILSNSKADDAVSPEHSMADGLFELSLCRSQQRTFREIEILKFRGADHFLGRHDVQITNAGLVVRPRTEMLLAKQLRPATAVGAERQSIGVPELDMMLGGGLMSGSTTMLLGFAGSGKTMLSLHFIDAGARAKQPGLYFGFYESPDRLLEAAHNVKIPLSQHKEQDLVDIIWQPPLRYGLDSLAERLLENVERRNVKRLVIDGIDGIRQSATFPERSIRFLTAMVEEFRARDVTVLLTEETQKILGPEIEVRIEGLSPLVENIVLLDYVKVGPDLKRTISVVKQRASRHETTTRELCITGDGLTIRSVS